MPPTRRPARWGLLGLVLVLAACSSGPRYGLPEPVTEDGVEVLDLWRGMHVTAIFVGLLVWGLVLWCVARYRRRSDDELPGQSEYNVPVEVVYTVAPLVVVAVLFGTTMVTQERVTETSDDPDVAIEVVGFQWSWEFRYLDEGVEIEGGGDELPEMVLPVGSVVRFDLRTADVNHAFWVPEFLVKRDMIPRIDNAVEVRVTEEGTWTGRCAEFCGLEHYRMNFIVSAVPPDEYEAWLDDQRTVQRDREEASR